ncbi:MAG: hypothetical protein BWK80_42240 [Desulfobacteraceae bacterium IS3]|nr:MAG: hypothetical protein BWK80_42240 [Desulfobacteraceae bacterium IS3]HAO21014.1 transposase [Desulfobacteraceae bacterium]
MKAYSADLRKKVLKAYQNGQGSMRQLAGRFAVSLTFVFNLIRNFKQNGHIAPKPHGGGKTSAINQEGCEFLSRLIRRQPRLTLKELCGHYEQKFGKKVSKSAMDRTLKKMNITRTKNAVRSLKKQ